LHLGIAVESMLGAMRREIAAARQAAEAAKNQPYIAAAAALPQEPEPVKPRIGPDAEIASGFNQIKEMLARL
jgi:hypothetical protein